MYITKAVQKELFDKCNTPPHIQAHCNAVAETARKLAIKLNQTGYDMDVDVIYGAALVHDVLRLSKDHAKDGAELLYSLGYIQEGNIVREHMRYPMSNDADHLEEIDVVCLGDRTVREDEYVGLDLRMQYLIDKPGASLERTARILQAKEHTRALIEGIEARIGMTFDELLG